MENPLIYSVSLHGVVNEPAAADAEAMAACYAAA